MMRVKKNDTVFIKSGKDKGKRGSVLDINYKDGRVLVQGVALATHHQKPKRTGEPGGIFKKEAFIDLSKVMPVCSACNKPCRVNVKGQVRAERVRVCNRCQATL